MSLGPLRLLLLTAFLLLGQTLEQISRPNEALDAYDMAVGLTQNADARAAYKRLSRSIPFQVTTAEVATEGDRPDACIVFDRRILGTRQIAYDDYVALKGYGDWFWLAFLINGPILLTAHAIVMAWLWRRTGGSTFAVVLYHFSVTASAIVAPTAGSDGLPGVLAAACGAGVMWAVALVLLGVRRADFADRQQLAINGPERV